MRAQSRNLVASETAERNRSEGQGGYTFNALIPDDYEGSVLIVAALRLGDHAHVEISSGRATRQPYSIKKHRLNYGKAGNIILRWHEWELLRSILESHDCVRIAEVERPSVGQLFFHGSRSKP